MKARTLLLSLSALILAVPQVAAQEYTIEQRTFELGFDTLYEMVGEVLYENPVIVARQLFAMPLDDVVDRAGSEVDVTTAVIHVKGDMVRMGNTDSFMLMDLGTGTVRMVNARARTYFEWTREDVEAMEAAAAAQMEDMGIDPDEEYEMDSQFDAPDGYEDEFVDENGDPFGDVVGNGSAREINGFATTSVEAAGWESISVSWCSTDQFFSEMFAKLVERTAWLDMEEDEDSGDDQCEDGISILTQAFSPTMQTYSVEEVVSVSTEPQSDDLFVVPDGFRKTASPF